jgi:SAM-dependent methyltransferase
MSLATGTILELGPGTGNQLPRYTRSLVSQIYGIEPNKYLFHELHTKVIAEHGMTDIYVPVHGRLEDEELLMSFGIGPASVDTVVCMQVLCSVDDVKRAMEKVHAYLKPGGSFLF